MNAPDFLFQTIFNHLAEPRIVVKVDAPRFTIIACNEQYKLVSNTMDRDIIGKGIGDIHDNAGENAEGDNIIRAALQSAALNKKIVKLDAVRYDIPASDGEIVEQSWWQAEYVPITGTNGETEYIMCTTYNITSQITGREAMERSREQEAALQREKALTEQLRVAINELHQSQTNLAKLNNELEARVERRTKALAQSEDNFKNIILQAPVAMGFFSGEEMTLQVINDQFLELWKKPQSVIGKPLLAALPELEDQPYLQIMQTVLSTGESYYGNKSKVFLQRDGRLQEGYFDFINQPFKDAGGNNTGIIVVATEVTEQVFAQQHQQLLNEELAATNEELAAANEELTVSYEELEEAQAELQEMVKMLTESEARFRTLVQEAPVAICIFKGRELLIEAANNEMQQLLGKTAEIAGKTFADAVPELDGQPFFKLLDTVFTTGNIYYGNEDKAVMEHNGKLEEGYYNFIYQPIKDKSGITTAVMVVATDVTEQVTARKKLEEAEELQRLSIEAANIGTWSINTETREMQASPRLKELFGYYPDEEMSYEKALAQITEDYRDKIATAIEETIDKGGNYSMEHTILGFHDQKLRWVRALGKLSQDTKGNFSHFSGVLIDITEQKLEEIRKNDFIAIVSHELKTPLTSLKAYVQILSANLNNNADTFTIEALHKANNQVSKMTGMINSFLNVARLEAGKIHLNRRNIELDKLIRDTIAEVVSIMQCEDIYFLPCEPLTIYADPEKMGQVLNNLLSNAIKYSIKEKHIEVACISIDGMAQVSVKDNGVGIKPEDTQRLFERFYRVESVQNQTISGFGIGLYLASEIVQRHEGKIWVESELGKGSTFHFSVPMA